MRYSATKPYQVCSSVCVCVCESYDFQLHAVLFDVIPITLGSILTYKVGTSCTQYRTQNILATLLMF